ncbi:hemagglutinin repeat-containing protein [Comamonas sp. E6]|uniref:hemagglutinin repeat-containing protein n=1 Tax=Comamonas sp. E6 TaxID=364029 RepID=UPI001EE6B3BD|nr:hemagglutinin repeat-containing protein [Comamonas sp. E6]
MGVPIGGGLHAGQSKVNSNYQSVTEQSGIQAGDGGFQVSVKGDTDLKGAVIASNQTAIDQDKNRFSTGGALTTSDLHNSAHYDGQAVGVNASVGNDAGKFGVKGGADGSILVRGSDITAGQDATLAAEGDIRLCVWCLISSLRPKAFPSHRPQSSRPWCWGRFQLGLPTVHWAYRRS